MLNLKKIKDKSNSKIVFLSILLTLTFLVNIFIFKVLPNLLHPVPKLNIDLSETTGKEIEYKPMEKPLPAEEQRAILIEFCPIKDKKFNLDFSFKENKFVVELKPPTKQNHDEFINWLKNNGFQDISLDKFIFSNYQP